MKIVPAGYKIRKLDPEDIQIIEEAARTCYKSEGKIGDGSAEKLIRRLISSGHEAMLEHSRITVVFTVDRGISHELVRHRMASFAQESTRWCNYGQGKFGGELTFIEPCFFKDIPEERKEHIQKVLNLASFELPEDLKPIDFQYARWCDLCGYAEQNYLAMLKNGSTPQEARSVLPNSLKTEIWVTANYREWRHILKLRTAPDAHPQMREVMIPLLAELHEKVPVIFDDIFEKVSEENSPEAMRPLHTRSDKETLDKICASIHKSWLEKIDREQH